MTVQVLLSTYNGEKFLEEQVESIMSQIDVDVKLLIRDDGSKDNTRDLLNTLKIQYADKIDVIFGENIGVTGSFFELVKQSSEIAMYYAFADQDDVWASDKLSVARSRIEQHAVASRPFLYVGNYTPVNEKLEVIEAANTIQRQVDYGVTLVENIAVGCTMVMNKALRDAVLSKAIPPAMIHDWYIYLLAQTIGDVYIDTKPTMYYRQHENNVIGNRRQSIGDHVKKLSQLPKWAEENRQQLRFIEQHYQEEANEAQIQMLSDYLSIRNKSLRERYLYNKKRPVRRMSTLQDKVLSILILLKKV